MIKIWQSYASNNSTSYRLVARFADAAAAREIAAELTEFFDAQEKQGSHRYEDAALTTLARNYGFDWVDSGAGSEGPQAIAEGEALIVYYPYCLGIGPGVPAFLADRNAATIERESSAHLRISALFRAVPGVDPRLDDELAAIFVQPVAQRTALKAPWVKRAAFGRWAFFRDAGTVGMHFPIAPSDIARFKTWLADHDIENVVISVEHAADEDLFLALAKARCTACDGVLEYLDPRLHDIESPQLACKPCGGLYELSTFL